MGRRGLPCRGKLSQTLLSVRIGSHVAAEIFSPSDCFLVSGPPGGWARRQSPANCRHPLISQIRLRKLSIDKLWLCRNP